MMVQTILETIPMCYAAIFAVLNPLSGAFIFLNITSKLDSKFHRLLAKRVALNVFFLLFSVVLVGSWILKFFGITIPIIEVAGGLAVGAVSWSLMNTNVSSGKSSGSSFSSTKAALAQTFFPLTMPITAGPGSIAVTLALSAREFGGGWESTLEGEAGLVIALALIALTTYFCYAYAEKVVRKAGPSGANVIMKLSAFINFCIGLSIIWHGIQGLLHLS